MRAGIGGDRGAVLVEAMLVMPLLLILTLGSIDLANLSLQQSQASSGARDGARVAILHYRCADSTTGACANSSDAATVAAAATAKVGNRAGAQVTVRCLTSGTLTVESCRNATPDADYVEVTVSWPTQRLTGFTKGLVSGTVSAKSRMAIVGFPLSGASTTSTTSTSTTSTSSTSTTSTTSTSTTTTTTPLTCASTGYSPNPASGKKQQGNSGHLVSSVTVTITTNGASNCQSQSAIWQLVRTNGPTAAASPYAPTSQTINQATFTLGDKDGWALGTYQFTLKLNGSDKGTVVFTVS